MVPYFFAFNMLNYARLTAVYLSQMTELKEKDLEAWEVLQQGNFSVNKSSVPFSAIWADHGLEQQNHALKFFGGIKGIANSQAALDEFFSRQLEKCLFYWTSLLTTTIFAIPERQKGIINCLAPKTKGCQIICKSCHKF